MDEAVTVGPDTIRAIGSRTRAAILKSLLIRQKTQSELASELGLALPTVLEHMVQLEDAGLIERVEEDKERKWKYYRLTQTGRKMVQGQRMEIILILTYLSAAMTACLFLAYLLLPQPVTSVSGNIVSGNTGGLQYALRALPYTGQSFIGVFFVLFLTGTIALLIVNALKKKN